MYIFQISKLQRAIT